MKREKGDIQSEHSRAQQCGAFPLQVSRPQCNPSWSLLINNASGSRVSSGLFCHLPSNRTETQTLTDRAGHNRTTSFQLQDSIAGAFELSARHLERHNHESWIVSSVSFCNAVHSCVTQLETHTDCVRGSPWNDAAKMNGQCETRYTAFRHLLPRVGWCVNSALHLDTEVMTLIFQIFHPVSESRYAALSQVLLIKCKFIVTERKLTSRATEEKMCFFFLFFPFFPPNFCL